MEYVEGTNLQKLIEDHGRLSLLRAVNYIAQTASGLQHAFQVGLVHRDIKPANLLVDRRGVLKILDLGLARLSNESSASISNADDNSGLLGTADYLAPEQAINASQVDTRADIYSLGATFYFLLTGKPPFPDGTVAQKLIKHQTTLAPSVRLVDPEIPQGVADVVARMMAKLPDQRYANPGEVFEALRPWITPISAPNANELPGARYSSHSDINLDTMMNASVHDTAPLLPARNLTRTMSTMSSFELPKASATVPMKRGVFAG
jgi:serine/threonine protein kinase